MIKVYEAVNARVLSVPVSVAGAAERIVFNQGDSFINANYRTSDKAVQQALDKSPLFGSAYVLRQAIKEESDKAPAAETPGADVAPEAEATPEAETPKPKPAGRPKTVKN
jgi:hypothetical protein